MPIDCGELLGGGEPPKRRPLAQGGRFASLFQREPTFEATAPGRVNLIGEHTDYNGGFVLPTPIPQRCHAWLAPRTDRDVHAATLNRLDNGPNTTGPSGAGDPPILAYGLGFETRVGGWLDYLQGLTWALAEAGHPLPSGFDLLVHSDVPHGSGLSSSAAFEVAVLRAIREGFALPLDDVALARVGQRAENGFVGAQTGLMDQFVASIGRPGHALFLDTRTLAHEHVPLPPEAELMVVDSGIRHQLATGEQGYNTRRVECAEAAARLGLRELRDATPADLPRVDALPDPLNRRARHVIEENARVEVAVEKLRAGDLLVLGQILRAGHVSLRVLYEVSVPHIDLFVNLAEQEPDVYGARLTGGGFGGSIVGLARRGTGLGAAERIAAAYHQQTGRHSTIILPTR